MVARGRYLADWIGEVMTVVLGIVMAMVPLALWFAWSEAIFYIVLGIGAGAFTLIYMLGLISGPNPAERAKRVSAAR
ncbi:MAG TPA: hypothetical protein QF861_12365 [Alphaproteobacteria bacterium]|nr:hypothetical protein [Alphaproteobacteria bacterium]